MQIHYKIIIERNAEKFLDSLVKKQQNVMYDLIGMLARLGYTLEYPYSKKVHTKKNGLKQLALIKSEIKMAYPANRDICLNTQIRENDALKKCLDYKTPYEPFEELTGINVKNLPGYALIT